MAPRVMTVSGPIAPDRLGFTLPHEHTGIALWHVEKRWDYWELSPDEDVITDELRDYRRRGGGTLVDLTLDGVGRDPLRLRGLASATGLNIVMGAGWYRERLLPARDEASTAAPSPISPRRSSASSPTASATRASSPGIIGEIGTDKPWVSALEERVHRAASRASLETGMAITTHGVQSDVGLAQLAIFTEEGVDPSRVIIGHADSFPSLDFYLAALDAGANIQFDFLGHRFGVEETLEPRLVEIIVELLERGYAPQILLSQDVCHNRQLKAHGGFGYVYLQQHFLPTLRTAAVGEGEITRDDHRQPRAHAHRGRRPSGPMPDARDPVADLKRIALPARGRAGALATACAPFAARRRRSRSLGPSAWPTWRGAGRCRSSRASARSPSGPSSRACAARSRSTSVAWRPPARGRWTRARRRCDGRFAVTATPTPSPPTAARPSARWPRRRSELGHEYLVITDHSPRLTVANGLSVERLRAQLDEIATLNDELAPFRILTGIEVDINEDGTLDQEPELLAQLDVVVGSVHSALRSESRPMTIRMVTALATRTSTSWATAPAA